MVFSVFLALFRGCFLLSGSLFEDIFIRNHLWIMRVYLITRGLMNVMFDIVFVLQSFEYCSLLFLIWRQHGIPPNEILYNEQFRLKKNIDRNQLPLQVKKNLSSRNKEHYHKWIFRFLIIVDVTLSISF